MMGLGFLGLAFPVAIPAGSTLAALAAGSAVVIKPAKQAARSGASSARLSARLAKARVEALSERTESSTMCFSLGVPVDRP